tara:strand:+ start:1352 stop:1681 length:330 start_codon:yes stop_codon:yes gene_type:complete
MSDVACCLTLDDFVHHAVNILEPSLYLYPAVASMLVALPHQALAFLGGSLDDSPEDAIRGNTLCEYPVAAIRESLTSSMIGEEVSLIVCTEYCPLLGFVVRELVTWLVS